MLLKNNLEDRLESIGFRRCDSYVVPAFGSDAEIPTSADVNLPNYRVYGSPSEVERALIDSKSPQDFERICKERNLWRPQE